MNTQAKEKTGVIYGINGPVVYMKDAPDFMMSEMVYVGKERLVGEVISLKNHITTVFNNTYTRKGGGGGGGGGGRRGGGSTPTPTTTTIPETEPEVIPGMLPKTGMLWWPVPVLTVAGLFFLAAGFILERRRS